MNARKDAGMALTYDPDKDFYEILEVDEDADTETIKKARIRLARQYHSDIAEVSDDERMKLINEAYDVLSDHDLREEYDELREAFAQDQYPQVFIEQSVIDFGKVEAGTNPPPIEVTVYNRGGFGECYIEPPHGQFWEIAGVASDDPDPTAYATLVITLVTSEDDEAGSYTQMHRVFIENEAGTAVASLQISAEIRVSPKGFIHTMPPPPPIPPITVPPVTPPVPTPSPSWSGSDLDFLDGVKIFFGGLIAAWGYFAIVFYWVFGGNNSAGQGQRMAGLLSLISGWLTAWMVTDWPPSIPRKRTIAILVLVVAILGYINFQMPW